MLIWYSNWGQISHYDIRIPNVQGNMRIRAEHLILKFEILFFSFKFRPNIAFRHSKSYFVIQFGQNIAFWHSKSCFDIRTGAEYLNVIFEILFWHSNSGGITHFDNRNPILTFEFRLNIAFWLRSPILTYKFAPTTECWHSKFHFNFRISTEYRILTIDILFVIWIWAEYRILPFEI